MSEMAAASIKLDTYVQGLFCRTAHRRTITWFPHNLVEKSVFTELSEVDWPASPQDNYFADICITTVLKGLRRCRKDESQTNLMGNPWNTGMALFLTVSIHLGISNITSTKAKSKYQTSFSAVFTKM